MAACVRRVGLREPARAGVMATTELMTVPEAAELLRCSTRTIHRRVKDNGTPGTTVSCCSPACLTRWTDTIGRDITLAHQALHGGPA